jgi:dihydrodipicolinate synthase/N-acetylneuraminate lyase
MATIKAWSQLVGLSGGDARPPLQPLSPAQKEELRRDLATTGLLAATGIAAE